MTEPPTDTSPAYLDSLRDRILAVEPPISERLCARACRAGDALVARLSSVIDAARPTGATAPVRVHREPTVTPEHDARGCDCDCRREALAVRAACALAELRSTSAVDVLVSAFARPDPSGQLRAIVEECLLAIGEAVLEPALRAHERASDPDARASLLDLMLELDVSDERLLRVLVDELGVEPWSAAGLLVEYDPRAAHRELERRRCSVPRTAGDAAVVAALEASLRGWAAWALEARSACRREVSPPGLASARPPAGRNAPCPCGAGRKYKKCCMR